MLCSLGPFDVYEELARGGMGVVLRAAHRTAEVPVAVKVVADSALRHERYLEDFRTEVQSAAQLSHPNIVTLLEYGTVGEAASRQSEEELVAGCPYLVMELADGGSLLEERPDEWQSFRRQLLELLDALAHAHAHGVVHRDLKPGNVLLHRGDEAEARVKLADFGIAHASDHRTERRSEDQDVMGTAAYMAPEQIEGRWRDFGPWTDLYALGIMTHHLVTGSLPFTAEIPAAVLVMHLMEEMPVLWPRFEVPKALGAWVRRLTNKDHRERFHCAADAAHALRMLEAPIELSGVAVDDEGEASAGPPGEGAAAPWAATPAPWDGGASTGAAPWDGGASSDAGGAAPWSDAASSSAESAAGEGSGWGDVSGLRRVALPPTEPVELAGPVPLVEDWRQDRPPPSFSLHGAGLGLYFLRTVPLIGREEERDRVWRALKDAAAQGSARALTLRGPAGTGKSRLAEWMCQRAHETGAATVLRATHEVSAGPTHGMPRMIAHHYGAVGLETAALRERLAACLSAEGVEDALEVDALVELIDASRARKALSPSLVRFSSPAERYVAVEAVLRRAASERPVVVWLDDVQWGGDSVAMVRHALEHLRAPVLFLLTAREEVLVERDRDRAALDALDARDEAETLRVGALAAGETSALVERLLGLSGELADRVCARVDGNPLFAVQLVGDWVARGVLQITPRGFALRPGERGELPDSLHEVWADRVERLFEGRPDSERALLELAAVLGLAHDEDELAAVCEGWGESFPAELLEDLARARLIDRDDRGWAFVHGMLRESLVREAARSGRAPKMHRTCAEVITARGGKGTAGRRAHHLAEGGLEEEALEPFLVAARELVDGSDYARALSMLARREALLARLELPADDVRWGQGWALRADVHRLEWDFDAAKIWAENARSMADQHGWTRERAEAELVLAHVARQGGEPDAAIAHQKRALELFHRLDDDDGRARVLLAMAILYRQKGEYDAASGLYARAYALFEMGDDERGAANSMLGLAHLARHAKSWDDARGKYEAARERCERAGFRSGTAHCLMGRADVQRYQGELDAAEEAYRAANRIQMSIGSKAIFVSKLNLGLVLTERERWPEARALFEAELPELIRAKKNAYVGWVRCVLLPCCAHDDDAEAFDLHFAEARERTRNRALVDEDMAKAAQTAAAFWAQHGAQDREITSLELARDLFEAVGDAARRAEVEARLSALRG